MQESRYHYNKGIAITEEDLNYIKKLKTGKMGKKSLAGILSYIISEFKKYGQDL